MKIVINRSFGGFAISGAAYTHMGIPYSKYEITGHCFADDPSQEPTRTDPRLIAAVETLGAVKASGFCAALEVVEIPDGVDWIIDDYDGKECVHEKHRQWPSGDSP